MAPPSRHRGIAGTAPAGFARNGVVQYPWRVVSNENIATANTLIVINPVAGSLPKAEKLHSFLLERLDGTGLRCTVHETQPEDDLPALVREACHRGVSLVIVAGGDGTVGEVVNGLVGTGAALGIIPVGTGNLVARAVGIPLRWTDALDLILGDHEHIGLDTMRAAGRHFILNISTGISSRSILDTTRDDKRRFGILAYVWHVLGHIFGFKSHRFDLELDGYRRTVDATELLVSNGTLMDDLPRILGPRETFCDGRIDAYVINGRSVWDYLAIIARTIFRRLPRDDRFIHFPVARRIRIAAQRRSQPVQGDGEDFSFTPVEIEVVPGAVPLIVPVRE